MRIATFVVVLAIHAVLLFLFAALQRPARRLSEAEAPTTLVLLSEPEATKAGESMPKPPAAGPAAPVTARAARAAAPKQPTAVSPAPEPESEPGSSAITPTPAPDWRAEAAIAANHQLETEALNRERPSPLAPHDFSGVTPGSTDTSKPKFGWYGASIHRVEGTPGVGLVVHINDRCAVAILLIFPFPACKIGKIPVRSDLFDHMNDAPAAGDSKLP